ncbi:hypothetical protein AC1031_007255 [Aphanomyces cochlioides]|nr:hypothetical protein AC1031_007255 [Aphanomyces cochlioides]
MEIAIAACIELYGTADDIKDLDRGNGENGHENVAAGDQGSSVSLRANTKVSVETKTALPKYKVEIAMGGANIVA